uniref:PHP domain-containing protein n=1 Tax=Priestia megaterium TaxID=1404 RepID=UPI0012B94734
MEDEEREEAYGLVLLGENDKGYENVLKVRSLVERKEKQGVKKKWVQDYRRGVIGTRGGVRGEVETVVGENEVE